MSEEKAEIKRKRSPFHLYLMKKYQRSFLSSEKGEKNITNGPLNGTPKINTNRRIPFFRRRGFFYIKYMSLLVIPPCCFYVFTKTELYRTITTKKNPGSSASGNNGIVIPNKKPQSNGIIFPYIKRYLENLIISVFKDPSVEKEATVFLEHLFDQPKTHDAALVFIKNVLKSDQFIDGGKIFIEDIFTKIMHSRNFQSSLNTLLIKTFKSQEIENESLELLKFIINAKSTETLMINFFTHIFTEDLLLNTVTDSLAKCAYGIITLPETNKKAEEFILKLLSEKEISEAAFKTVVSPLPGYIGQALTFGMYKPSTATANGNANENNGNKENTRNDMQMLHDNIKIVHNPHPTYQTPLQNKFL